MPHQIQSSTEGVHAMWRLAPKVVALARSPSRSKAKVEQSQSKQLCPISTIGRLVHERVKAGKSQPEGSLEQVSRSIVDSQAGIELRLISSPLNCSCWVKGMACMPGRGAGNRLR